MGQELSKQDYKRVGILTFHYADNFGCVLQCYGLQEAIKQCQKGWLVEIINLRQRSQEQEILMPRHRYQGLKSKLGSGKAFRKWLESLKNAVPKSRRIRKFEKFRNLHLSFGEPPFYIGDLPSCTYDYYVVGSDQVWNYWLVQGKERYYFLHMAGEEAVKVSYAASIGRSDLEEKILDYYREHLQRFDYLSIREKSTLPVLQTIYDKEIRACLDPTLLHTKEFWSGHTKKPHKLGKRKYVLMYGLGYTYCQNYEEEACKLAKEIAETEDLEVLHYYFGEYRNRFLGCRSNTYYFEGPQQFLWLVEHAEHVVCCSFHGTVFSVIFQKSFYTFSTGGNSARVVDLLDTLGLKERFLEKAAPYAEISRNIEWGEVEKKLRLEREYSWEYIREVFGG